jgi:hypothetical protein
MKRTISLILIGIVLVSGLALAGLWLQHERQEARRSLVVSVPPGTAARLAAGETIELFPQEIRLRLSEHDTLVVRNDDSEPITIGPYRVEPGQRFVQRYASPGTFELLCSLHSDETLRIVVTR